MFSKKNFSKNKFLIIIATLSLIVFSVIVSYFSFGGLNWKNIFNKVGISDFTTEEITNGMSVHFIDVGKADCTYIHANDVDILVDAGDVDQAGKVVEYLKRQGVQKLDLVIASHPHRDHIGQMAQVVNEFKIDKFIEPDIPENILPTSRTYENMLQALKQNNVNASFAVPGSNFEVGDVKVEILGPCHSHEKLNNNSVVAKISYGKIRFLFTGDAEKFEEDDIMLAKYDLKSTVLKVAHHGSSTSCSNQFLNKVSPKYAVIHVANDRHNCPREDVIKRLSRFCGDDIYRTDLHGTIIFNTDGQKLNIKTEK